MSDSGNMNENETNESGGKKHYGFLKFLIALLIIGVAVFVLYECIQCVSSGNSDTPQGSTNTSQGNSDDGPHLFRRSAENSDVIVDSDLDLSAFGAKYTVTPQTDIDNLEITIRFLDEDRNVLTTFEQTLGNVREGVQVSFSISLFDLGLSVALKTEYESWSVTGGTVSYFA